MNSGRRPRDPQGRRQAILDAALELVIEVGIARTSHRAIAERAGVPLGSTTYYFPTLPDLVAAALEQAAERVRREIRDLAGKIGDGRDVVGALIWMTGLAVGDRQRMLLEYELYLAAVRNDELRELAGLWLHELRTLLAPLIGAGPAAAVGALLDGVILQAMVTGEAPDPDVLEVALTALVGRSAGKSPGVVTE
ncbi:TetR/AcrR family transcriptional regulator [Polymorphospora rubra]|uniref:EbrA repressor n=1 Tax=Polymorphospora rubra TaxID=338584 RepID=A0A810N210_9ACTN|nr:TetR family transcriptional regulator [Polymorphospora rubra]BCJ67482.1 ebrA repressor [Polymorphospora rubra]